MTAGRHSVSETKDWCTPKIFLDSVRIVIGGQIALDPCSNAFSIVDASVEYWLPDADGLKESWDYPTIFVNPPYGTDPARGTRIAHWFERISEAAANGSEVIALVPGATNTSYWKKFVYPKVQAICFIYERRVKFIIGGNLDTKELQCPAALFIMAKMSRVLLWNLRNMARLFHCRMSPVRMLVR
jgi:hypothetical protein